MTKRTRIDKLINEFLLSKLNPLQFANEYFINLSKNELIAVKNYYENNLQDEVLENFYLEQLSNIPIVIDEFIICKVPEQDKIKYIDYLKNNAFDTRIDALKTLFNDVLPEYLNEISNTKNNSLKPNEYYGLNYQENLGFIQKFHKSLVRKDYIEVEYKVFKKFFTKTFINDDKKIYWKKPLNHLYYLLIHKLAFRFVITNYIFL